VGIWHQGDADTTELNVQGAFELRIESLEEEVNIINNAGSHVFLTGNYQAVDEMRGRVDIHLQVLCANRRFSALCK